MGFRSNTYAKVWDVKREEKFTDVRLSISRKNKMSGEYEQDFSGFVRFVGTAHQQAATLQRDDRIKLGSVDVTNRYDKDKDVTYTNFVCFSFEPADGVGSQNTAVNSNPVDGSDNDMPF